jgi:E3 ubiquitin-protein ligase RNF1/2
MKSKVDGSHSPQRDPLQILRDLVTNEFKCAICLDTCTDTNVNPQCGHRFCKVCIKKSLTSCKHECPNCRAHIPTYRTLRQDAQFDRIVSIVHTHFYCCR